MIKIVNGNILDAKENIICHQVNCQGVMGSGLAKQIRAKHPEVYLKYSNFCNGKSPEELLGQVEVVQLTGNKGVANLFGQLDYGRDSSRVYTDYDALEKALYSLRGFAERNRLSVAIPYNLGCGLANGDWYTVYGMIIMAFDNFPYDVTIYEYNPE